MSGTPERRRHSPAVYRRRRLLVLLIALLVIAGIVWLVVAQPWRGFAASTPAPSPTSSSASPTPSGTPSATPEPATTDAAAAPDPEASVEETPTAEPCMAANLIVEAVTDKTAYAAGENPQLTIKLINRSETDCTLNVGTSAQSFTVSSGSDTWWRSTDCQTEPSDMLVLLQAGQEVASATPVAWDRTRSSVDTCQAERPQATGGGATYHLSVAIGGISSSNAASFQLN